MRFHTDEINFSKEYYKFDLERFTTIRGTKGAYSRLGIGNDVQININSNIIGDARILNIMNMRIKDIGIYELKLDADCNGVDIRSYNDFIELINSHRRFHKIEDASAEVMVILLEWVRRYDHLKNGKIRRYRKRNQYSIPEAVDIAGCYCDTNPTIWERIDAFQALIDSGDAWTLPGYLGRIAMSFIEYGWCKCD